MRRALSWLLTLIVSLAALVGLIALINSRDQSGLEHGNSSSADAGPGEPYKGEPILSPGDEDLVKRGNVVVLYRDATPPPGTQALVPDGGRALVQAGQSVVLDREPTLKAPLAGVSATKIQPADTPSELKPFIDYWLGGGG
jgi:hypothetical protein